MSLLEGIFSRGGEETGDLIETAFRLGCRFDGWSDHFRFDLWEDAIRQTGIDPGPICGSVPPVRRSFPGRGSKAASPGNSFFQRQSRLKRGEPTPDCRTGPCSDCGVCDHRTVHIVTAPADAPVGTFITTFAGPEKRVGDWEKAFRLRFTKLGPARFLSHLELSTALSRALILGGIFFVYSQGFHPHPRISFAGATAVGMESRGEFVDIRIQDPHEALGAPHGAHQRRPPRGRIDHGDV